MSWTYTDTADQVIVVTECTTELVGVHIGINARDGRSVIVCIPADKRRNAAQAVAGPDYRVVPRDLTVGDLAQIARDAGVELDMDLRERDDHGRYAYDATCPSCRDLAAQPDRSDLRKRLTKTIAEVIHVLHGAAVDRVDPEADAVAIADVLVSSFDFGAHPARPEPADPASVRVGDIVEIEAEDGSWMVRGEVRKTDELGIDYPLQVIVDTHERGSIWPCTTGNTVRVLHRPEPEPDEAAVEAWRDWLRGKGCDDETYCPDVIARELARAGCEPR